MEEDVSAKNEYEMSLEMQSKLAIMSFSLRVSQAKRSGSKISLGLSPPCPDLTISSARWTLSRRGAERLASFDAAIVSSAEEMRTTETVLPLDRVSERLCESIDGREGARPFGVEGLLSIDCLTWPFVARGDVGTFGRGGGGRRAAGETGVEVTGLAGGVGGGAGSSMSSTRWTDGLGRVPLIASGGTNGDSEAPLGACETDVVSVSE